MNDYGKVHEGRIISIAISPDSHYLFTSDFNGDLKEWDIVGDELQKVHEKSDIGRIWSICITADSQNLFTADIEGN